MKTGALCAMLALTTAPALAAERQADAPGPVFAACAGRFSAEMEHGWLHGATGDMARDRRDLFLSLLDAVGRPDDAVMLLDTRIRAKHAQARLLLQASFHTDPVRARRAGAMAAHQWRLCDALLLG